MAIVTPEGVNDICMGLNKFHMTKNFRTSDSYTREFPKDGSQVDSHAKYLCPTYARLENF